MITKPVEETLVIMEWTKYEKRGTTEMTPVTDSMRFSSSFPWPSVSISEADEKNGSPKEGDMIARNTENHDDMWLVSKDYFKEHYRKQKRSNIRTMDNPDQEEGERPERPDDDDKG